MKSALIGLTLFLLMASAWAGRLTDNFDDGNMDGWMMRSATLVGGTVTGPDSPNSTWRIENGELIVKAVDSVLNFVIGEQSWKDYTVGMRVKIVEFPEQTPGFSELVDLKVRFSLPNTGYGFAVGTFGTAVKQVAAIYFTEGGIIGGQSIGSPFEWELDTWYELEVTAKGDSFQFKVDGELVVDYVNQIVSTGKPGFSVSWHGTTAHIDDFFVEGDDIPDSNLSTAVDPKAKLATMWGQVKGGNQR